jgi:hypothetical protein
VVRESVDYYSKLINVLEVPYFQNLRSIGIDVDQYETIFSKLYNQPVSKYGDSIFNDNGKPIYYENSKGFWVKREYDDIGNLIFIEKLGPYGSHWNKYEYDDNGNKIYNEDSSGHWIKKEYDEYGNQIYSINSNGYIIDKRNNN